MRLLNYLGGHPNFMINAGSVANIRAWNATKTALIKRRHPGVRPCSGVS